MRTNRAAAPEPHNATAIDNDGGKPGEVLAAVCHEAAIRLRILDARLRVELEETSAKKTSTTIHDPRQLDLERHIEELSSPRDFDGMPIINDVGC